MTSPPKLEDVARLAGVSTATVSRVFNAPERVRAATREKIEEVVRALGYTPHFSARALASNRTQTVGVVIPTMENAIFARGLQAMQETLAETGVTLLVATSNYDGAREAKQIVTLIGRGVDGLILIGEAREAHVYETLKRHAVPFVVVWSWRADLPWPCVGFDNRAAAREIAERVLDAGHSRIAMIAGITRDNDRARGRIEGVRDALAGRGLGLEPRYLVEADYTLDAGATAAARVLCETPPPSVVVCGNDVLAAGAILAARELGLRVPQDVSITGFDDIELARLIDPPLTTVHVPHRRMGEIAARMVLDLRAGVADPPRVRIPTEVVRRGSLGPPR